MESRVLGIKGVREAQFDAKRGELIVTYDEDETNLDAIIKWLQNEGIDAKHR